MRKEKKFEDTDVFSYAAGMMGAVEMEANCQRAKALLRTVRTFHLTREEAADLIKFQSTRPRGTRLTFRKGECRFVKNLDCLRAIGKGAYGGGMPYQQIGRACQACKR